MLMLICSSMNGHIIVSGYLSDADQIVLPLIGSPSAVCRIWDERILYKLTF
jgi:hypothetical protein